ncbi:hypothetical protein NMY22_g16611 [Coprinellus aureogranulatus]|nr:hypothetical protein NMY22_g16611 [Coprinellus aureogranulatus]
MSTATTTSIANTISSGAILARSTATMAITRRSTLPGKLQSHYQLRTELNRPRGTSVSFAGFWRCVALVTAVAISEGHRRYLVDLEVAYVRRFAFWMNVPNHIITAVGEVEHRRAKATFQNHSYLRLGNTSGRRQRDYSNYYSASPGEADPSVPTAHYGRLAAALPCPCSTIAKMLGVTRQTPDSKYGPSQHACNHPRMSVSPESYRILISDSHILAWRTMMERSPGLSPVPINDPDAVSDRLKPCCPKQPPSTPMDTQQLCTGNYHHRSTELPGNMHFSYSQTSGTDHTPSFEHPPVAQCAREAAETPTAPPSPTAVNQRVGMGSHSITGKPLRRASPPPIPLHLYPSPAAHYHPRLMPQAEAYIVRQDPVARLKLEYLSPIVPIRPQQNPSEALQLNALVVALSRVGGPGVTRAQFLSIWQLCTLCHNVYCAERRQYHSCHGVVLLLDAVGFDVMKAAYSYKAHSGFPLADFYEQFSICKICDCIGVRGVHDIHNCYL